MGFILCGCNITNASREKEADYKDQGIALMEVGKYEEAAREFQLALDQSVGFLSSLDVDICYYKASALFLSGDSEGAIEVYGDIIDYSKKEWGAYYLRGIVYLDSGDTESAEADFDSALDVNGSDYDLYINIYENLVTVDADKAALYLSEAMALEPGSVSEQCSYGYISYLNGDTDSAVEYLTAAVEENYERAYLYLAHIKMDTGDYEEALSLIEKGLSIEGGECVQQLSFARVVCYEYLGDFESAKEYMAAYIADYPADADAARENTFLETR